jgi:uncharacterized Zn finger protein
MNESGLEKLLTRESLLREAGDKYFARGEQYHEEDLVERLRVLQDVLTAKVLGTETYEVRIAAGKRGLEFDCTCPLADDGTVCKHCVAVGLAWLAARGASGQYAQDLENIRRHLVGLDQESLIDILMKEAHESDRLFQGLSLAARRNAPGDVAGALRKEIDRALRTNRFVDYYSMRSFSRGLGSLVDEIDAAVPKHAAACIELCEYFLSGIERKLHSVDDSDGSMRPIMERLEELHHKACLKAKPEPAALARRLFERSLKSEWDVFSRAAATHGDVMGKEGRAEYRRLAEAEWAKVPRVEPGGKSQRFDGAFRITFIMETLADLAGDPDAMAAVLERDLSSAYSFLRIAEVYEKAGRRDEALSWAERGCKAFTKGTDGRLREFLAKEYQRRKRHDESLALIWSDFQERPGLNGFQELKAYAERAGQWPSWREKAIELVRAGYEAAKKKSADRRWFHPDLSDLVEIFLWERDPETAWAEAQRGGCRPELWLKLASLREESRPQDALPIYRNEVKRLLDNAGYSPDYAEVVRHVRHVRELMHRLNLQGDFSLYLDQLRTVYKRKRNFMKLLERVKPGA